MKRFLLIVAIITSTILAILSGADTLRIAACDYVSVNIFDDMVCLSAETGILRRYVDHKLQDVYTSDKRSTQPLLQMPGQPVFDGADRIYLLDMANNTVIGWDRFLNIHSITNLDDDIVSPGSFTVTSEHDWLIYDDFYSQILQIRPGGGFYSDWGDKPVSGHIDLYSFEEFVFIHLKDQHRFRISDVYGTTLKDYPLPDSIDVENIFPLKGKHFALVGNSGVYIWKPQLPSLRYLSDMTTAVYCKKTTDGYMLISQEGTIITIR